MNKITLTDVKTLRYKKKENFHIKCIPPTNYKRV